MLHFYIQIDGSIHWGLYWNYHDQGDLKVNEL